MFYTNKLLTVILIISATATHASDCSLHRTIQPSSDYQFTTEITELPRPLQQLTDDALIQHLEQLSADEETKEFLEAAKNNDIEKIKKLLVGGANINNKNEAGITPLMRAAQNNNVEMVEFLLSRKADPNITDNQNITALEWALYAHPHTSKSVQKRTKQILELLLKAGAKKTATAYKTAVKFGYPEDILTLLKLSE